MHDQGQLIFQDFRASSWASAARKRWRRDRDGSSGLHEGCPAKHAVHAYWTPDMLFRNFARAEEERGCCSHSTPSESSPRSKPPIRRDLFVTSSRRLIRRFGVVFQERACIGEGGQGRAPRTKRGWPRESQLAMARLMAG